MLLPIKDTRFIQIELIPSNANFSSHRVYVILHEVEIFWMNPFWLAHICAKPISSPRTKFNNFASILSQILKSEFNRVITENLLFHGPVSQRCDCSSAYINRSSLILSPVTVDSCRKAVKHVWVIIIELVWYSIQIKRFAQDAVQSLVPYF